MLWNLLVLGGLVGWPSPAAWADITTGLVGYWKLDEPSGTTANDDSATNNDGTYQGSPTLGAPGYIGTAVTFNGTTAQFVSVPDNGAYSATTTGTLSIAAWVNFASNPGATGHIVAKGNTNNWEWSLAISTTGQLQARLYTAGGGGAPCWVLSSTAMSTGVYHHVLMTIALAAGTNSSTKLYVDGSSSWNQTSGCVQTNGTALVNVARRGDTGGPLAATIDEVRIYNRDFSATPSDIAELVAYTGPAARKRVLLRHD